MPALAGKIEGEMDVKRLHLPGDLKLMDMCPKCGGAVVENIGNRRLSYPTANMPFKHHFYCDHCDHNWPVMLRLNISLEIVT